MIDESQCSAENVITQLRADHYEIQNLLRVYADESSKIVRKHLLTRLCRALRLHCALEAGVFVPALAIASGNRRLLEETGEAYARVSGMINELAAHHLKGDRLQKRVAELHRYVDRHIAAAESEEGLIPQSLKHPIDWSAMESQLAKRRAELTRQDQGASAAR